MKYLQERRNKPRSLLEPVRARNEASRDQFRGEVQVKISGKWEDVDLEAHGCTRVIDLGN
ncbi:MAG: hypothetical protein ACE5IJ_04895 [Thermoplasmata archaeon]